MSIIIDDLNYSIERVGKCAVFGCNNPPSQRAHIEYFPNIIFYRVCKDHGWLGTILDVDSEMEVHEMLNTDQRHSNMKAIIFGRRTWSNTSITHIHICHKWYEMWDRNWIVPIYDKHQQIIYYGRRYHLQYVTSCFVCTRDFPEENLKRYDILGNYGICDSCRIPYEFEDIRFEFPPQKHCKFCGTRRKVGFEA